MNKLKKLLGLGAAVFALAALFGAGSASAQTVFCKSTPKTHICPSGDVIPTGTSFAAHLTPGTELKWEAGYTVTSCKGAEVGGTIGYAPTGSAQITKVSNPLTECTNSVTTYNNSSLFAFWQTEGGDDGIGNLQNIEYGVKVLGAQCYYTATSVEAGVEIKSGTSPRLVFHHKPMKRVSGGFICPMTVYVEANYTIDTPTPLYVEQQ